MSEFLIPHPVEQALACKSLVVVAKNTSEGMDKFMQWMLTGFGAGLTYLLGQPHITFASLKIAGMLYVTAALIGIFQHYFAMIVSNGANTFAEAEKLHDNKTPVDLARFFIIYIDSMSGFQRWAASWAASKFMAGNMVATGKGLMTLAFFQLFLGALSTGLLFVAAYTALKAI